MKRLLCIRLFNGPVPRIGLARPARKQKPVVPQDTEHPPTDREALAKLAVWCQRFSPVVGVEDSPVPDSLLLDVTGLGSEALLAGRVVEAFTQRGLDVCLAIADTLGAAWAMTHFDDNGPRGPARANLATRNGKEPRKHRARELRGKRLWHSPPIEVIPPGEAAAALRPLPIEALRLPEAVVDVLHPLGIDRIGQVERLPREALTSRFGPRLLMRWDQATGRLAEPIPVEPSVPKWQAERSFEDPIARRKTIEQVTEQLVAEVARKLVRGGRGALRLACRFECSEGQSVDLSVGLFQPTAVPRHLFELIEMQLERVSFPAPVAAMHVEATRTAPFERVQRELFDNGRSSRHPRQLAGLVDRLSSRLGQKAVLRVRLMADAQPERAYRYHGLVGASPARRCRGGERSKHPPVDLPLRPLRLLGGPVRLAAVSLVPQGLPLQFRLRGHAYRILHAWGPERIETGWWRGRAIRRDYYRIETTAGQRFWLFRRLDDGAWFLHGIFE